MLSSPTTHSVNVPGFTNWLSDWWLIVSKAGPLQSVKRRRVVNDQLQKEEIYSTQPQLKNNIASPSATTLITNEPVISCKTLSKETSLSTLNALRRCSSLRSSRSATLWMDESFEVPKKHSLENFMLACHGSDLIIEMDPISEDMLISEKAII